MAETPVRQLKDNRRWIDDNGHAWTPIKPWSNRFINDYTQQEWDWDLLARAHRGMTWAPLDNWTTVDER